MPFAPPFATQNAKSGECSASAPPIDPWWKAISGVPWPYMAACLGFMVFAISPLVQPYSLFFFSLGGLCSIRKWDFFSLTDRWIPWPVVIAGCIAAIIHAHSEGSFGNITTQYLDHLPCSIMMLKLSKSLTANRKVFEFTRKMAPQSMFLHCSHGYVFLSAIMYLAICFIDVSTTPGVLLVSLITFIADVAICTALGMLLCRYFPKLFSLLVGARYSK